MKYVYMLKVGESHYKVGVANNVRSRVKDLQTSNPNLIEIVTTKLVEDAYEFERQMHIYLEQLKADGGKEWFVLSPEQAISLAITINHAEGVDLSQQITLRTILDKQNKRHEALEEKMDIIAKKLKNVRVDPVPSSLPQTQAIDLNPPIFVDEDAALREDAKVVCRQEGKVSTSLLQRHLRLGYGRAARIVQQLEEDGFCTPADASRPREIIEENPIDYNAITDPRPLPEGVKSVIPA